MYMRRPTLIFLNIVAMLVPPGLCAQDFPPADLRLKELKKELKSTTGKNRVDLLLATSRFYIDQKGVRELNMDSATSLASEALQLSKRINYEQGTQRALFLLGSSYMQINHWDDLKDLNGLDELMSECNEDTWAWLTIEGVKRMTTFYKLAIDDDYDSLVAITKKAHEIGERSGDKRITSMALLQYANINYNTNRLEEATKFLERAISESTAAGYLEGQAEIFSQWPAEVLGDSPLFAEQVALGEKVKKAYLSLPSGEYKTGIELLLVLGYDQVAYHHVRMGNLHEGMAVCMESINLLEKSGNPNLNEYPYQTAGKIYLETGDLEKVIEYTQLARELTWRSGSVLFPAMIRNVVRAYISLNKIEEALQFISESFQHGGYSDILGKRFIAECYGSCYVALGQYQTAEKYYLDAYAVQKQTNLVDERLLSLHIPIARLYTRTHKYNKAEAFLKVLVDDYVDIVPANVQRDAYHMLFRIDSALGRSQAAMKNLYAYQKLNDSLFNERKNKQIEELTVKYETEKKDRDLDILRKQTDLQQAELKSAQLFRNGLVAGAGVLVIILGLVYSRFRLKQRTNRLLEESQERISQSNLELQKLNDQLQKLLGEKEWLVREIHHRVKNNLQIVISLLRTQAAHLTEGDALAAIHESQSRIQVISLLHQKLYKDDTDSTVQMTVYIPDLVNCIREGTNDESQIHFDVRVDNIQLDISQAVPVGLILNEAITNSIKYAYPGGQHGVIHVYLLDQGEGKLLLRVSDEGQGLPSGFDKQKLSSFGMKLIETLAEQLEGTFDLTSDGGTKVEIAFVLHKPTRV